MKRVLTLLLAATLVFVMAVPGAAITDNKRVSNITRLAFYNQEGNAGINPEETFPGDEIIIPLVREGFEDADGAFITWNSAARKTDLGPTVAQLKGNNIGISLKMTKGADVIRDWEFVKFDPTPRTRAQAAVRIRFVEDLVSTKELDWELEVTLTLRGTKSDATLMFEGMISNEEIDLFENDYVHLGDGSVGNAQMTAENVRVDAGNGVTIYTDMIAGEKYYAVAKFVDDKYDSIIIDTYPEVVGVYRLYTINTKNYGNIVEFSGLTPTEPYYVYNLYGEYIGRSNELLPYSLRYYIATAPVEIDVDLDQIKEDTGAYNEDFMSPALKQFMQGGQAS